MQRMSVDPVYCSSSFLQYRTIVNKNKCFSEKYIPRYYQRASQPILVETSSDLEDALASQVKRVTQRKKTALALSGGIDSAVLAKYMPKGSKAYTFKCVVPGVEVVDESKQAKKYAEECGLEHEIIEITWDDVLNLSPLLMKHKGAPIHSIEVQIYKAAKKAKKDGIECLIFGESADCNYGGLSNILSRDWLFGEYVDRYSFVLPYKVLKQFDMDLSPFLPFVQNNGTVDVHEHFRHFFFAESMGSYSNALDLAGVEYLAPYANTWLNVPLDYDRVRRGENKYLIREIFNKLYPGWNVPKKTPMPRPTSEWLRQWTPSRTEFWPNCTDGMSGDQKWLVWSLEKFLNIIDDEQVL